MPITKERFTAVVNAALRLESLFIMTSNQCAKIAHEAQKGNISKEDALLDIISLCLAPEHQTLHESKLLIEEQTHWRLTHRKNDRDKIRREKERRATDTPTRIAPRPAWESHEPNSSSPAYINNAPNPASDAETQKYADEQFKSLGLSLEEQLNYIEKNRKNLANIEQEDSKNVQAWNERIWKTYAPEDGTPHVPYGSFSRDAKGNALGALACFCKNKNTQEECCDKSEGWSEQELITHLEEARAQYAAVLDQEIEIDLSSGEPQSA